MPAPSDPSPEMLNDPDGRQLVAAIHARRAGKTTAAKDAHLMFITTRAEALRKWISTDLEVPRNLHGLERALDAQVGDVDYLIAELRKRDEAIARVEARVDRLAKSNQCEDREIAEDIRNALKPTTTGDHS